MHCHFTSLVSLAVICLAATAHAEDVTVKSAETFIKDWVTSFTQFDPERAMAFYDRSKETEVIVSTGERFRGYEAILKTYQDAQTEVRFLSSTAKEMRTRIVGNTALVTFEHIYKTQVLTDDSRWQGHVRTTSVLHRIANKWKIVLEHSSPIRGVDRVTRLED